MKKILNPVITLIILTAIVVALWYVWYQYVLNKFPDVSTISDSQVKIMALRGQFGDMFGGVNALFTALLLAGALYTVFLQQRQLALMQVQQAAQEQECKKTIQLQAMTALVAARSTIVHTRYEMMRDITAALNGNTVPAQFVPIWQVMAFKNAETMGREFQNLGDLAERLNALVESETKEQEDTA